MDSMTADQRLCSGPGCMAEGGEHYVHISRFSTGGRSRLKACKNCRNERERQRKQGLLQKAAIEAEETRGARIRRNQKKISHHLESGLQMPDTIGKSPGFIKRFGTDAQELKRHVEAQFSSGMSWENRGKGGLWRFEKIIPADAFDLGDPEQLNRYSHYTNLRPVLYTHTQKGGAKCRSYLGMQWDNGTPVGGWDASPIPVGIPVRKGQVPPGCAVEMAMVVGG